MFGENTKKKGSFRKDNMDAFSIAGELEKWLDKQVNGYIDPSLEVVGIYPLLSPTITLRAFFRNTVGGVDIRLVRTTARGDIVHHARYVKELSDDDLREEIAAIEHPLFHREIAEGGTVRQAEPQVSFPDDFL